MCNYITALLSIYLTLCPPPFLYVCLTLFLSYTSLPAYTTFVWWPLTFDIHLPFFFFLLLMPAILMNTHTHTCTDSPHTSSTYLTIADQITKKEEDKRRCVCVSLSALGFWRWEVRSADRGHCVSVSVSVCVCVGMFL